MNIPKNRSGAINYYLPLYLIIIFIFLLSLLFTTELAQSYLNISNNINSYINLALVTYCMPVLLIVVCLYAVHKGFLIYKYKYNPPLNIPVFKQTESKKSKCPVCFFALSIFFLLFSLYMLYFGHNVFIEIYSFKNT